MDKSADFGMPHLRIVRSSDDPIAEVEFTRNAIESEMPAEFKDHDGSGGGMRAHNSGEHGQRL
jgi:hypothetical protein